jgi:hypothetical protein
VANEIEQAALLQAQAIVAATAYVPLLGSTKARDDYCAARTGGGG